MRTKEDLRSAFANMLRDLRERQHLSKAKISRILDIDDHTWNAWESGKTSPSLVDFITVFDTCGESIMRPFLEFLYPDQYSSSSDLRDQLSHFSREVATDHAIEIMSFIALGEHGSEFSLQAELICAYNHLPLETRFIIAETIYTSFLISMNRGDLVATDSVMPDMPVLEDGLRKAQKAAYTRMRSYNTITEEEP